MHDAVTQSPDANAIDTPQSAADLEAQVKSADEKRAHAEADAKLAKLMAARAAKIEAARVKAEQKAKAAAAAQEQKAAIAKAKQEANDAAQADQTAPLAPSETATQSVDENAARTEADLKIAKLKANIAAKQKNSKSIKATPAAEPPVAPETAQ